MTKILWELFDRENIDEQSVAFESLKRERSKDTLSGDYGSVEENDFWVFFTEVIWVEEEGNAKRFGGMGMVRARASKNSVALGDEGFG